MINTAAWSFSWRWRAELQQHVLGPFYPGHLSGPEAIFKERGPPLTGSMRRPPSVLLWSSSFDHLSHPTSPFSSQKRNEFWAECEFVRLRGNKCKCKELGIYSGTCGVHAPSEDALICKDAVWERSDLCMRSHSPGGNDWDLMAELLQL